MRWLASRNSSARCVTTSDPGWPPGRCDTTPVTGASPVSTATLSGKGRPMPSTITSSDRESRQIEQANASERTPVVFIHGLWLLPSSWDRWAEFFENAGYAPLTPSWPDDPETVEEARANPEVL